MLNKLKKAGYRDRMLVFPEKIFPLHYMVTSCGYSRPTTSKYDWDGLRRGKTEFVLFQYTLSGTGRLDYEDRKYVLGKGDAMILHFPHRHRYFLPNDSDGWEFIYVCMNGRDVLYIWREIEKRFGPVRNFAEDSNPVSAAARLLLAAFGGGITNPFAASSLSYQLSMSLLEELVRYDGGGREKPEFIRRINEYCAEHPDEDLDVGRLAKIAGFSRYHFTRRFKSFQGVSPGIFMRDMKMKRSLKMLQSESVSVKEAAASCGFDDPSYYCKAFKKTFGISPGNFKKSGMY